MRYRASGTLWSENESENGIEKGQTVIKISTFGQEPYSKIYKYACMQSFSLSKENHKERLSSLSSFPWQAQALCICSA